MDFDKKEALRYLGIAGVTPDEPILALVDETAARLMALVSPKSVYKKYPLTISGEDIDIGGFKIKSKGLSRNLSGCESAYLFAATLGTKADSFIRMQAAKSMGAASVAHAVCAALIESYCDEIQDAIYKKEAQNGYSLRPRFSPGYSDFSITHQKELLGRLDAAKHAGITLTDNFLMIPSKSVSAVIGVKKSLEEKTKSGCDACENKGCDFKKSI